MKILASDTGAGAGTRTIVVADRSAASRDAVAAVLGTDSGLEVVGQAATGPDLLGQVGLAQPDVVVTDLSLPNGGEAVVGALKAQWPHIHVVVLSLQCCAYGDALAAGADAFVAKGDPTDALLAAVWAEPGPTRLGGQESDAETSPTS